MNPLIYPHGLEELGAYIYAMLCKNLLEEGNSDLSVEVGQFVI